MFSRVVQPESLSLFSSSSSRPDHLASIHTPPDGLPETFIALVQDHSDSALRVLSSSQRQSSYQPIRSPRLSATTASGSSSTADPVLHLQCAHDSLIPSTSIRFPNHTYTSDQGLGISLPYLHFHIKNLGRNFVIDIGIKDRQGRLLVVRASTSRDRAYLRYQPPHPPLLILPLHLPSLSRVDAMTPWCLLSIHLPTLLSFARHHSLSSPSSSPSSSPHDRSSVPLSQSSPSAHSHSSSRYHQNRQSSYHTHPQQQQQHHHTNYNSNSNNNNNNNYNYNNPPPELPSMQFGMCTFVHVHANCRLRRILFTSRPWDDRPHSSQHSTPDLYLTAYPSSSSRS